MNDLNPTFPTPAVVVSRCLGFDACRYNGEVLPDSFIDKFRPHVKFLPVCPEVQIGLGVPRDPIHIEAHKTGPRLIQPSTGLDLTARMTDFSESYLDGLKDVDGFILKSRSPSCGLKDVKLRRPNGPVLGKTSGMFGGAVMERFPHLAIEDEARLTNRRLREHFLTRLFLWARFRQVKKTGALKSLVRFHAAHKLLLMAYSPVKLSALGNIVANREKKNLSGILADYEPNLGEAMAEPPSPGRNVNVFMHAFGYFSDDLKSAEKNHFLAVLESYRKRRQGLSGPLTIFQNWLARFETPYLAEQTFFFPFPAELNSLADSGKERA